MIGPPTEVEVLMNFVASPKQVELAVKFATGLACTITELIFVFICLNFYSKTKVVINLKRMG
jgi:hypothetical protein